MKIGLTESGAKDVYSYKIASINSPTNLTEQMISPVLPRAI